MNSTRQADDGQHAATLDATIRGERLQTAIAQLRALVDECRVHVSPDGLRLPATDPAAVASVDLELAAAAFNAYDADEMRLGVNLERLGDVVGMADRDQAVRLSLDPATRKLRVSVGELAYTLALIDPDAIRAPPDLSDPDFDFTAAATLAAADLRRAVRAADMVSDHVAFGVDPDAPAFYADAEGDTDDVAVTLSDADLAALAPGDAHSLFSVDYLRDLDRALPRETALRLRLGTDVPLAATYEFADGAATVEYLLGPRIAR